MSLPHHETSWLLHSLRRAGNPVALSVKAGPGVCAWKALQDAGMSIDEVASAACAASGAQRATAADLAAAHMSDLRIQGRHGVRFMSFWFDYDRQSAFCLVEAPDAETAQD
ncbi:MAG TPA: nickel-binding protein, partial [Longimicrobium sp.]